MSVAYLRMFTCAECGRRFVKSVGGFVLTPETAELRTRPVCDSCKAKRAVSGVKKGINALMGMARQKREKDGKKKGDRCL